MPDFDLGALGVDFCFSLFGVGEGDDVWGRHEYSDADRGGRVIGDAGIGCVESISKVYIRGSCSCSCSRCWLLFDDKFTNGCTSKRCMIK